jgi:hypothetical protein
MDDSSSPQQRLALSEVLGSEIVRALGLPPHCIGFTLRFRAGEPVEVESTHLVPEEQGDVAGKALVERLAHFRLVEADPPPAAAQPAPAAVGG